MSFQYFFRRLRLGSNKHFPDVTIHCSCLTERCRVCVFSLLGEVGRWCVGLLKIWSSTGGSVHIPPGYSQDLQPGKRAGAQLEVLSISLQGWVRILEWDLQPGKRSGPQLEVLSISRQGWVRILEWDLQPGKSSGAQLEVLSISLQGIVRILKWDLQTGKRSGPQLEVLSISLQGWVRILEWDPSRVEIRPCLH